MKDLCFSFGVLSDKLSEQYKRQGYELKNAEKWDELVHSTVMLHIHGILTDSRYDECRKKILKKYKDNCVESIDELKNTAVKTYRTRKHKGVNNEKIN